MVRLPKVRIVSHLGYEVRGVLSESMPFLLDFWPSFDTSLIIYMMKREIIPMGAELPVKLTLRERNLIREETFYDPDFAQFALVVSSGIQVDLSLDDIEDIQGYVAAEANHTEDRNLERELDKLSDKLQAYLDKHNEPRD